MLASLGNRKAVGEILGIRLSGFVAWVLWRGIYLSKLPSLARKLEVVVDWTWTALFPPDIVQLQTSRTGGVGLAHYAPGEFVFHKGEPPSNFFTIESGVASVYLDEVSPRSPYSSPAIISAPMRSCPEARMWCLSRQRPLSIY